MKMRVRAWMTEGVSWAGLFIAPAAWAMSTQANYALAPWACGRTNIIPLLALALALLSLGSGFVSWRAWRRHGGPRSQLPEHDGQPRNLLAGLSVLSAGLFGLVILLQGAAGLVFDGCER